MQSNDNGPRFWEEEKFWGKRTVRTYLERYTLQIHTEFVKRRKIENEQKERGKIPLSEISVNFLKREIYRLGCECLRLKLKDALIAEAKKIRKLTLIRKDMTKSPFNLLLLCTFAEDRIYGEGPGDGRSISRADRELFAMQLAYARRHRVPAELVCGFLLQSGSPRLIRQKYNNKNCFEPAFGVRSSAQRREEGAVDDQ